jgi:glycosyltransferase involved in cell wall biosynthesis
MVAYTYYESDARVIRAAEAAVEGGFEVDVLALRKAGTAPTEVIRGVRLIRLNQAKYRGGGHLRYLIEYALFFLRCFLQTTGRFFTRRYRVIHVNNMPDFLVFTTIIPRLFGTKVILDIHDPMPDTFTSKFKAGTNGFFYRVLLWQELLSAAYSNRVLTVHCPVRDGILVKHGLAAESIDVISNFPDAEYFPLRPSFNVNGRIRLAFHGTILERSGLRMLMNAFAQIRHKDQISVKIIGEGDFSQPLKEMIQSLGLGQMVEFDNHDYPADSMSERIGDCNAGVVPLEISAMTNYALPMKLVEYISMGLPVVSVRNDAISYYLGEDDCIFFEWNDPRSLATTLDRIAENPDILLRYRERSVALRQRFSWAGEKKKYIALLRQLSGIREAAELA